MSGSVSDTGRMSPWRRSYVAFGLLVALVVMPSLPGCEDDAGGGGQEADAAADKAPVEAKKRDAEKKTVKDEAKELEEEPLKIEYVYNPIGRRDPFKNSIAVDIVVDKEPITPLQKYDLDQYKVVAVIWGAESPIAMVQDPEGNGHFLRVGTLVGRNWGKVARINEDSVVVAEEYRDFTGQLNVNEIVLSLPDITSK